MEKKQTAVEWLWKWIMDNPFGSFEDGVKAYNQAKQMETECNMNTFEQGYVLGWLDSSNNLPNKYE